MAALGKTLDKKKTECETISGKGSRKRLAETVYEWRFGRGPSSEWGGGVRQKKGSRTLRNPERKVDRRGKLPGEGGTRKKGNDSVTKLKKKKN